MKIKLDENIGTRGSELLAERAHDVSTVRDQKLSGAPDENIFAVCAAEGRVLVTLDRDFGEVLRFPPEQSAGIVILDLGPRAVRSDCWTACEIFEQSRNSKMFEVRFGSSNLVASAYTCEAIDPILSLRIFRLAEPCGEARGYSAPCLRLIVNLNMVKAARRAFISRQKTGEIA